MKKLYLGLSISGQSCGDLSDALAALSDEFAELDLSIRYGEDVEMPRRVILELPLASVSGECCEDDDEPISFGISAEETQELDAVAALPL